MDADSRLLAEAGLDASRYRRLCLRSTGADLQEAAGQRFCPYTGNELVLVAADQADHAFAGHDAFTRLRGDFVRYSRSASAPRICTTLAEAAVRDRIDLFPSSGAGSHAEALRGGAPSDGPSRFDLSATQPWLAAAVRHGRLYALSASEGLVSIALPAGTPPVGWRNVQVLDDWDFEVSELRAADTVVYANLSRALMAWHPGRGDLLLEVPWSGRLAALARISFDRVLLVLADGAGHRAEMHDLSQVAQGQLGAERALSSLSLKHGPHALWAECLDSAFVLRAGDGAVALLPFDGQPYWADANIESWYFGPPALHAGPSGMCLLSYAARTTTSPPTHLAQVPLDSAGTARVTQVGDSPLLSSHLAPCVVNDQLVTLSCDMHRVLNVRLEGRPGIGAGPPAAVAVVLGSQGAGPTGLEPLRCGDRWYVHLEYVNHGQRYHWFGDEQLASQSRDGELLPSVSQAAPAELHWDASGAYLCDLTTGTVHCWSPR